MEDLDMADLQPGFHKETGELLAHNDLPEMALLRTLAKAAVEAAGELNYRTREQVATSVLAPLSGYLSGLVVALAHVLVHHYGRKYDEAMDRMESTITDNVLAASTGDTEWPLVAEVLARLVVEAR